MKNKLFELEHIKNIHDFWIYYKNDSNYIEHWDSLCHIIKERIINNKIFGIDLILYHEK